MVKTISTPRRSRQTERRTDGRAEFSALNRVYIPCSAVKINAISLNIKTEQPKLVKYVWI